jgi:hypothetical protein
MSTMTNSEIATCLEARAAGFTRRLGGLRELGIDAIPYNDHDAELDREVAARLRAAVIVAPAPAGDVGPCILDAG